MEEQEIWKETNIEHWKVSNFGNLEREAYDRKVCINGQEQIVHLPKLVLSIDDYTDGEYIKV